MNKDLKLTITCEEKFILTGYCVKQTRGNNRQEKLLVDIYSRQETAVSWNSKRTVLNRSRIHCVLSHSVQEVQFLMFNQRLRSSSKSPIKVYEDNQSCIKLSKTFSSSRTKHIDTKYHYVRDLQEKKIIELEYCKSCNMLADIMTKPLPNPHLSDLRCKLNLRQQD